MKNRIVAVGAAATIAIAGLSACGPDGGSPAEPSTASTAASAGAPVPGSETPAAASPGNPHFSDDLDAVGFVTDLVKANEESYRADIIGTVTDPEGTVREAVTTREVETVDGILHSHTVFEFDGEISESIIIGKDSWVRDGEKWEKVPEGAISVAPDTASGLGNLKEIVQEVTYEGEGPQGHEFALVVAASQDAAEDVPVSNALTIVTDDDLRVTAIESSNSISGNTVLTTEKRSAHGDEFGIEAPVD